MLKAMLFIDGTWFYSNVPKLCESTGRDDLQLDFGKLPPVIGEEVARRLGVPELDVARTSLFGSFAYNHDARDDDAVQRRLGFFAMLRQEHHYDVEALPVDFRGKRVRRTERDPQSAYEPKDRCVDIALAASMVYLATIPGAYDVAVPVIGDYDFAPAMRQVRQLGKRVVVVSIRGSCAPELADSRDDAGTRDADTVWLNDLLDRLELRYERHLMECESPIHKGDRRVWTTYHPRKGRQFFCDDCKLEFARQKQAAVQGLASWSGAPAPQDVAIPGQKLTGIIVKKIPDRGYGFVRATDGREYFFHLTDLLPGLEFDCLVEGIPVDFEVKRTAEGGKAGAAQNIRWHEALDEPVHPLSGVATEGGSNGEAYPLTLAAGS